MATEKNTTRRAVLACAAAPSGYRDRGTPYVTIFAGPEVERRARASISAFAPACRLGFWLCQVQRAEI
jgi:hypothetical protein